MLLESSLNEVLNQESQLEQADQLELLKDRVSKYSLESYQFSKENERMSMLRNILTLPPQFRSEVMIKILATQLKENSFLKKYSEQNKQHIVNKILRRLIIHRIQPGEVIFRKGDSPRGFYIVLEGSVNAYLSKEPERIQIDIQKIIEQKIQERQQAIEMNTGNSPMITSPEERQKFNQIRKNRRNRVAEFGGIDMVKFFQFDDFFFDSESQVFKHHYCNNMGQGISFGELGVMRNVPRSATVVVKESGILGLLHADDFIKILKPEEQKKIDKKMSFFQEHLLYGLDYNDQVKISYAFTKKVVSKGTKLFEEGEQIQDLILIINGQLELSKLLKIDLFGIDSDEKLSDVEKTVQKIQAKKISGLSNDIYWHQKVTVVSDNEFLGVWEMYKLGKRAQFTGIVLSEFLSYWGCNSDNFRKMLEAFPKFWQNMRDEAVLKQADKMVQIERAKIVRRQQLYEVNNLNDLNVQLKRTTLKNLIDPKPEKMAGQQQPKFSRNRTQISKGLKIDDLMQLKITKQSYLKSQNKELRKVNDFDILQTFDPVSKSFEKPSVVLDQYDPFMHANLVNLFGRLKNQLLRQSREYPTFKKQTRKLAQDNTQNLLSRSPSLDSAQKSQQQSGLISSSKKHLHHQDEKINSKLSLKQILGDRTSAEDTSMMLNNSPFHLKHTLHSLTEEEDFLRSNQLKGKGLDELDLGLEEIDIVSENSEKASDPKGPEKLKTIPSDFSFAKDQEERITQEMYSVIESSLMGNLQSCGEASLPRGPDSQVHQSHLIESVVHNQENQNQKAVRVLDLQVQNSFGQDLNDRLSSFYLKTALEQHSLGVKHRSSESQKQKMLVKAHMQSNLSQPKAQSTSTSHPDQRFPKKYKIWGQSKPRSVALEKQKSQYKLEEQQQIKSAEVESKLSSTLYRQKLKTFEDRISRVKNNRLKLSSSQLDKLNLPRQILNIVDEKEDEQIPSISRKPYLSNPTTRPGSSVV